MSAGDFDLCADENDKGYYFFERVHSEMICAELTEDYTDVTGVYSTHFPQPFPPYVREAPAHFVRNGKHYLFTSGTSGYLPNPSELAIADDFHGPYRVLGDPHPDDESNTSFHSQISCVFKAEGTEDLYIAMADRWLPKHMDIPYEKVAAVYERQFNPALEPLPNDLFSNSPYSPENTSIADYVWLPIRFEGEMAYIDWLDTWSPQDYR